MAKPAIDHALPEIGRPLPAFTLPDDRGEARTLGDLLRATPGGVVLFAYPEASSPLCTRQACDLRDALGDLAPLRVGVVGLSPDAPAKLRTFAKEQGLSFTLLGDEPVEGTPRVMARLGVWGTKSLYGRTYQGVRRTTMFIDGAGVVRQVWPGVRVPGHAARIVQAVRALLAPAPVKAKGGPQTTKKAPAKAQLKKRTRAKRA